MFLRGDEAPTGIDPATGTSYTGQNGVQVNGTLTLTEGSVLAAYGGGRNATTSNGGSGTISAANVFAKAAPPTSRRPAARAARRWPRASRWPVPPTAA